MSLFGRAFEAAFSLPLLIVAKDFVADFCPVQSEMFLKKQQNNAVSDAIRPDEILVNVTSAGSNKNVVESHDAPGFPKEVRRNNWLVVDKLSNRLTKTSKAYERGDLVVMSDPYDPDRQLVRRIAAKEKEWVRVNDEEEGLSYMVFVPEGYCWVEKETKEKKEKNRSNEREISTVDEGKGHVAGADSVTFGPVSMGMIIGKPIFIVWPPEFFGPVDSRVVEGDSKTE